MKKIVSPSTPLGGEEAKTWRYESNALVFAGEGESSKEESNQPLSYFEKMMVIEKIKKCVIPDK